MRRISFLLAFAACVTAGPAAAQTSRPAPPASSREAYPAFAPRGFLLFGQQKFTAEQTFEAVFDKSSLSLIGGGLDLVIQRNFFVEVAFSQMKETGERVFRAGDETFRLGIPLTARIRPFEVTGGYRATNWRRVIPFGGVGFGSYSYKETSDFSAAGEDVDDSGSGFILMGGAEVRVMRWAGVSVDVHYTNVGDIIGVGGISQVFDETDLGGTAFRIRIMIGR